MPQNTSSAEKWITLVKISICKEHFYTQIEKRVDGVIGQNANNTVLTFSLYGNSADNDGKPVDTFRTALTAIDSMIDAMTSLSKISLSRILRVVSVDHLSFA